MTIGVNIITYDNPNGLNNLINQFHQQGHTPQVFNTHNVPVDSHWAKVVNIGYNRSFARNVNESIISSVKSGHSHVLVACDDVSVEPGWDQYVFDHPQYLFFGIASCFILDIVLVKQIGYYDERFTSIGWEDCDYRVRMTQEVYPGYFAPDSQVNPPYSAKHSWLNFFTHLNHGPQVGRAVNYHDPKDINLQMMQKKWGSLQGPYVRQPGFEEINWYPKVTL